MAGEGITISHWISSPVRYQQLFKTRNLQESTEDHRLFALPGPECLPVKVDTEGAQADSEDEDSGEPMFQILLDVTQFKPEDILIQVFEGWLLIRGRHGVRMGEHGLVSRSFTRHYQLPDCQLHAGDLKAMLCHDGMLVVETKDRWWPAND
ncbi:heat shock protein beta-3 [Danio rerio]|uniref:Heat shock protein beta-3 n=1 Tax=Danio rerio TaxID=7955 RepID=A5JV81_DANRE|nr:heat shock protein beta-3 [Danio rerio]ABQ57499.1 small heat shock protein HSPB3 [Danio rerio]|eukprot:NP_001092922.1 heat shock protein beta-3 [Danio rerio]